MAAFGLGPSESVMSTSGRSAIANDAKIIELLRPYPSISRALATNPRTVDFLIQQGAMSVVSGKPTIKLKVKGLKSGGVSVWREFIQKIETYFMNLVDHDQRWTEIARSLAAHIHTEYLRMLPVWPSTGGTQNCYILLNLSAIAQSDVFQVYWSASGNITCEDSATATEFEASVFGQPTLRGVCVRAVVLRKLEDALQGQMAGMNASQIYNTIEAIPIAHIQAWISP